MTPEERLVQSAKAVAKMKRAYTMADKALSKLWHERNEEAAAVDKKHNALCDAGRLDKGTTYQHLRAAQKEYEKALIAIHKASPGGAA